MRTFPASCEKFRITIVAVEPIQGENINFVAELIELCRSPGILWDVCRNDLALFNSQRGQAFFNIIARRHRAALLPPILQFHPGRLLFVSFVGRGAGNLENWHENFNRKWRGRKLIKDSTAAFLIKSGWVQLNQLISKLSVLASKRFFRFFAITLLYWF